MQALQSGEARERRAKLDGWIARHGGLATMKTAVSFGYSETAVYRMVHNGDLVTVLPGTFRSSQWPPSREQLMMAICLRHPSAVISSLTAAALWNLRRVTKDSKIHILVPHSASAAFEMLDDQVVVHRCRQIDKQDIVTRTDGIRLTSPARTLLDIADIVRDSAAASILEQLINSNMGTMATHIATLARLGHARRPGTATMARVIKGRPKWRKAMQSDLEAKVFAETANQGLPTPQLQYEIVLPDGKKIRLDFAWPQFRIALEVDHPFWHAGDESSHRDKRRDRKAGTIGWTTIRITDFDVRHGLTEAISDVAATIELATHPA
ncbi:MAG: type IV toxin-antitoxin system AbiEi family antitoxin domain-containing protein [Ilumatobacteraceae bacterium]